MSTPGLRSHIIPDHPLLSEVFHATPRTGGRASVEQAAAALRAEFVYQPVRGKLGFDRLREARARDGSERSAINCFDVSTLLTSHLRRSGFSPDEVFVVLCDLRWLGGRVRNDFHACVLVVLGASMLWIDPVNLELVETNGAELLERYKVHVICNDRHVYFTEAEKKRLLMRDMPSTGIQCFFYGQSEPAVESLLGDPEFHGLLEACFGAGPLEDLDVALAERAKAAHVLATGNDGKLHPGPRLVLIPASIERELHAEVAPFIDRDLGIIAETIPHLEAAYTNCSASARFTWDDVCHSVVAGMLLDLSVGAELHLAEDVQRSHGPGVLWAFENVSSCNGFGVRWCGPRSHHAGVAQLWHVRVERPALRIEPQMVDLLAGHARGERVALGSRDVLYLRFLKLLRGSEITVPVFLPDDTERMLAPLMAGAARMVEYALLPAIKKVKEHPGWSVLDRRESHGHAAVRLLLEYAVDRAVDAGLLAPFPENSSVAQAWGTWLWIEPSHRPARLVPASFSARAEGS